MTKDEIRNLDFSTIEDLTKTLGFIKERQEVSYVFTDEQFNISVDLTENIIFMLNLSPVNLLADRYVGMEVAVIDHDQIISDANICFELLRGYLARLVDDVERD